MAKSAKLKILYGEGDVEVLAGQAANIEKAGHTVLRAAGRRAVQEALGKAQFDLVVLGPTLTRNDRHHLPYMVKKANKSTSVLVMHADGSRHPYVDACTDTGASLETVLNKIQSMKFEAGSIEAAKPATTKPAAAAASAGR
jgi:DNA-binding NtrC family response regulator